ncbi:uncharacterized protein GIQ15_03032 [Arthroderma uncinatum]|uniref:uncharacterized protein n=1 Tax=Arthroderma uncinatum TaxID=74035 RepID=UPI00144ABF3C|nr:uncharacterized protein GIQ15_03032 [Arthroderma uncinatum]KAF3483708.1 hypothetical protein GIQ15_03032 [Arthroderma uncinatum]
MAIIDGIEVFVKLSSPQRILLEYLLPNPIYPPLPWAVDSQTICQYINGVEGQLFEIFIRMIEEETKAGGADGIHISLKVGEGDIINHYYSIKFTEFERDDQNRLCVTIRSAIQRTESGHKNVLFAFGTTDTERKGPTPLTALDLDLADITQPLDGLIDVTLVKVTHHRTPRRYATVTSDPATFQSQYLISGLAPFAMVPIAVELVAAPVVEEQVIPAPRPFGDGHRFAFLYRTLKSPDLECICR